MTKRDAHGLTPKQRTIVDMLLSGKTQTQVARDLGVHTGTVYKQLWLARQRLGETCPAELAKVSAKRAKVSTHECLTRLGNAVDDALGLPASELAFALADKPIAARYTLQRLERTLVAVEQLREAVEGLVGRKDVAA